MAKRTSQMPALLVKPTDLGTFLVRDVILHRIPKAAKGQKDGRSLGLSAAPSNLDQPRRNFFRERIVRSLTSHHMWIVRDDGEDSDPTVPSLVVEFFEDGGKNLVEQSQEMARHLYKIQGGNSPEGVLAVVDGAIGGGTKAGRCLVVLKLEMDAAMLLEPDKTDDGMDTFKIRLESVTLNEAAKVLKAALFPRASDLAGVTAMASDSQSDPKVFGTDMAAFFLRFLGCRPRDTADRETLRFKETVESAISRLVADDTMKWKLENALVAELNSNAGEIDPKAWIELHVPEPDLQDLFLRNFASEDGSVALIPKETTLVADALNRRAIVFDNGLRLEGPADQVSETVEVSNGSTTIRAGIKSVKAKR